LDKFIGISKRTACNTSIQIFGRFVAVAIPIVSFSAGSAIWLVAPANNVHFKGMVIGGTSSLRVATIKLKGTGVGNGAVTVSAVRLADNGSEVASGAGSTSFTIEKAENFTNNIKEGTVSGIVIKGVTEPGFIANINLLPAPTIPEGKKMSAEANASGEFTLLIDFPIAAGYHKLTVQGQKDKTLTPVSDEIIFEISQAKGGSINILTDEDINAPSAAQVVEKAKNWQDKIFKNPTALYVIVVLCLIILGSILFIIYRRRQK
jgi:hypothetical protein